MAAGAFVNQPPDRSFSIAASLLLPVLSKPLLADLALLSCRGATRGGPPAANALILQDILCCALWGPVQRSQARQWGVRGWSFAHPRALGVRLGGSQQHVQPV